MKRLRRFLSEYDPTIEELQHLGYIEVEGQTLAVARTQFLEEEHKRYPTGSPGKRHYRLLSVRIHLAEKAGDVERAAETRAERLRLLRSFTEAERAVIFEARRKFYNEELEGPTEEND